MEAIAGASETGVLSSQASELGVEVGVASLVWFLSSFLIESWSVDW